MLVRDEDVEAPVAVEVGDDNIARVVRACETEARCRVGEGTVEIVAIESALTVPDEAFPIAPSAAATALTLTAA